MKIYPDKKKSPGYGKIPGKTEEVTRKLAIAFAFASVFIFFIKLLFL